MKKIISIILAVIFLIQVMVFIPSCFIREDYIIKSLFSKKVKLERLYGEKQEEINGKAILTVDDLIELFDIDYYVVVNHDMEDHVSGSEIIDVKDNVDREDSNNKTCAIMSYDTSDHKVIMCNNKYIFNVYTSIEDAHAAYCSLIADDIEYRDVIIPIKYRINNVVMWHTELDEVPISKVEYIDEICELFNIDYENEYISIETREYIKKVKININEMISYFENDDNYEVIKIKNGDLGTGLDYKVWGYLNAYVISNKELDSYLVVKEFIENEEDADFYVLTFDHWFRYIQYYECNGILYYDNHLISSDNTIWLQRIINLHSKGYF